MGKKSLTTDLLTKSDFEKILDNRLKNLATKDDIKELKYKMEKIEDEKKYIRDTINLLEKQINYINSRNTGGARRKTAYRIHMSNSVLSDDFRLPSDDDLL